MRMSLGGFFQFDAGQLLFDRPVILGGGGHFNQEYHYQSAVYVAFPLAMNNTIA